MVVLRLVKLQRVSKRVQDLRRYSREVTTFHTSVIIDADAREHRDLFTPQSRNSTSPTADDANLLWCDPGSPRAQELGHLGSMIHICNCNAADGELGGTASTPITGHFLVRQCSDVLM